MNVADLLADHGHDFAALVAEYEAAGLSADDAQYEVVVRLDYHLPADVVEFYGLDAH